MMKKHATSEAHLLVPNSSIIQNLLLLAANQPNETLNLILPDAQQTSRIVC
jgi:hypothetical protein